MSVLTEAVVFLGAAVVAVPVFKRLGFGAVLGYLTAGIVIGPAGLGIIRDVDNILHFAEFGVVLLLFVIGLELQPSRLWVMRKSVFGLGGAQVLVSAVLLGTAALLLGLDPTAAVVVGFGLSLSSTAFALQMLAEKKQLTTRHGRTSFSILLFQDLAVIPLLALIPLLGGGGEPGGVDRALVFAIIKAVAVIVVVVVGGRYLIRYVFRFIAATETHEVFTALALLTVIGTALLMHWVGLSMALGAFLAGVLLADSEYRHALEADLEPFKGLLLGLFFIAVGMSVNLALIRSEFLQVMGLVVGLLLLKVLVLFGIGRVSGMSARSASSLAAALPQGGEFAFVIFGVAVAAGVLSRDLVGLLIVVVTLSMVLTPFLFSGNALIQSRLAGRPATDYEHPDEQENHVIIAGFGRFGQIVARILRAKRIG
ncbi:MAG: monovalent cation:proton antiporter-2 (CPA2) family protein, partial [Gammaproteobacteria bacterium]|nr:monovalent cation:proton antiporter-2 (CPA2) family protein [Gammaproteobacteria bacterium]